MNSNNSSFELTSISLHDRFTRIRSGAMYFICCLFTAAIVAILVLVTGYLLVRGFHALSWDFFRRTPIPPGMPGSPGGMKNGLVGTAILTLLAAAMGIPIGVLVGVYLSEYEAGSLLARPARFVADVLAGVPSIVIGILGYELIVYPMGHYSGWAGAFALAFIMVPIIARTTEEMLRLVPNSYREASIALGATKARTILRVVLPNATGSIITGVMLGIARITGETAPLLFTALGSQWVTTNPNEPFPSLTVQIFDYARSPYKEQNESAIAGMIVLIGLIFLLNLGIRWFARPGRSAA
jgi:phosphate transport system permease protein